MHSSIDERIRKALDAEDAELYDKLAEPSLPERAFELMRGRMRWINRLTWVIGAIFMGISVYALVRFFRADEIREMLIWGGVFWFSMMAVGMLKVWFWMEMQNASVVRELKRVELQLARLSEPRE